MRERVVTDEAMRERGGGESLLFASIVLVQSALSIVLFPT